MDKLLFLIPSVFVLLLIPMVLYFSKKKDNKPSDYVSMSEGLKKKKNEEIEEEEEKEIEEKEEIKFAETIEMDNLFAEEKKKNEEELLNQLQERRERGKNNRQSNVTQLPLSSTISQEPIYGTQTIVNEKFKKDMKQGK